MKAIVLHADEVPRVLAGIQTQIRRPLKPWSNGTQINWVGWPCKRVPLIPRWACTAPGPNEVHVHYAAVGDMWENLGGDVGEQRWVQETWNFHRSSADPGRRAAYIEYRADSSVWHVHLGGGGSRGTGEATGTKWRPATQMSESQSRMTLEITGFRIERVQDITLEDMLAEGCRDREGKNEKGSYFDTPAYVFVERWNSRKANKGYRWESNPWAEVLEIKLVPNG